MKAAVTVRLALSGVTFRLACGTEEAHRLLRGAGLAYSLEPVDPKLLPFRSGWPITSKQDGAWVGMIRDA